MTHHVSRLLVGVTGLLTLFALAAPESVANPRNLEWLRANRGSFRSTGVPTRNAQSEEYLEWHRGFAADSLQAFEHGEKDARTDIANRRAVICTFGDLGIWGWIDSSGVPYEPVAGYVVTNQLLTYVQAYNGVVRQWVTENGVPNWSRLPWWPQMQEPRTFWDSIAGSSVPSPFLMVGETRLSPDGNWTVQVVAEPPPELPEDFDKYYRFCEISDSTGEHWGGVPIAWKHSKTAELLWGPIGSDLVLVRSIVEQERPSDPELPVLELYKVIDLRTGREISREDFHRAAVE